jgi:carbamate kinase
MSMGVFYHEKRKREFVISMILDGGGMIDGRPRTADGGGGGFPVCEEERTVNEWGTNTRMKTADRGVDSGGGGFPVCEEEQTVNEWGIETADRGRQTAE